LKDILYDLFTLQKSKIVFNMKILNVIFIAILLVFVSNSLTFSQCSMCRSVVESTMSNGRNHSAVGLNAGILYLLAAPYLLVAAIGFFWYKTSTKNRKERAILANQLRQVLGK
jgi:hypothetical protein